MISIEREYEHTNDIADLTNLGRSSSRNSQSRKAHFESKNTFRQGLSRYDLKHNSVTAGTDCKWDQINCSGVPLDYDPLKKTVYVDGSDAHTLLIGATGSKKSRLVVMPTVCTTAAAGEGMVICDPKGEIYQRTGAYLKDLGYRVHVINLREPIKGDGWNILEIPYKLFLEGEVDKACGMINDATISLMPVTFKDPFWDYSSRDMLFGLILLLFQICIETKQPTQIVNMMSVLKLREELFRSSYSSEIKETAIWQFAEKYDLIRMRLNGTVRCPEKTLSSIGATFDQHMSCFLLQPQIMDLLSNSTFDLSELGFSKMAVFLIMPDEKTTYHKIITIFIKQIYEFLIDNAFKKTVNNRFPVRINFILDEFSSLPQISDFPQMISASRSRNIRFTLVVQSKHQLKQRYQDETETILSNCTNWLFLTSRETALLQEISELGGVTGTNHERLISVSWLQHLNKEKGECLVFSARKYPYLASLPDIDVYDNAEYESLEMPLRIKRNPEAGYQSGFYFTNLLNNVKNNSEPDPLEVESLDDLFEDDISVENSSERTVKEYDLQKELEAKFDELFGKLDDDADS